MTRLICKGGSKACSLSRSGQREKLARAIGRTAINGR
jgi:hypothetical protein